MANLLFSTCHLWVSFGQDLCLLKKPKVAHQWVYLGSSGLVSSDGGGVVSRGGSGAGGGITTRVGGVVVVVAVPVCVSDTPYRTTPPVPDCTVRSPCVVVVRLGEL